MGLSWGIAKHSEGAQQHFKMLNSEIRLSLKTQAEVPLGRDVQYTCIVLVSQWKNVPTVQ